MIIFNSYVKLPEGICRNSNPQRKSSLHALQNIAKAKATNIINHVYFVFGY